MKKIKKICRRIFAMILLVSLLVPQVPAGQTKAKTKPKTTSGEDTQNNDSTSVSEKTKRDILAENNLTNTEDSVEGKNKGLNPLTGHNEVEVSVNPSYELMVGETASMNTSENNQRVTQTVYDLESTSTFKEEKGTVVKDEKVTSNMSSGEIVTAVRNTAFDPLGEGKDAYVAELMAVHSQSIALEDAEKGEYYQYANGTVIYLNIYDARKKAVSSRTITVGYLRYEIEEWQADAFMQVSAGDFNGDGKDELAVYCPTDTTKTSNDMTLLNTSSYVSLYEVNNIGTKENPEMDLNEMSTEDTRYYINVTDRNSNHTQKAKDTFKNTIDEICAVDLETIHHPSGDKDSLAIAVCPPRNGTKVTSSMNAETRVDIWLDAAKAPSASNLSKHSMRWDLTNYQSTKWDEGEEYDVMYYGGLSAGDMDNDGSDELVVAGYRIRNTANANKWRLDNRYLFIERLVPYDNGKNDIGYKSSGNVPQMINVQGKDNPFRTCVGLYGNEDKPTAREKKIFSPLTVECYKGKGRDFADVVFLAGQVYEWKDSYSANYVRKDTAHAQSAGGYKRITFTNISGFDGSDDTSKAHKKLLAKVLLGGQISFSNAVSGNFDNNPYGIEQLYTISNYMDGASVGTAIMEIKQKEVGEYDLTTNVTMNLKKFGKCGDCIGISLCSPDVDNDASKVSYTSQEVYYADPQPAAILQAPPYFSEIGEQDSDYLSTGSTSFTTSEGTEYEKSNEVTVNAGIIVGVEQSVSLFGLFKTGLSALTEISAGTGYEHSTSTSKTFTTTYNATKEDQVVTVAIPYIRYRYKVQNPTMKTSTKAKMNELSQKITSLTTSSKSSKKSDEEKKKLSKAATVLTDYYENQKKMIDEYGYDKTIKDDMVEMTYSQPGDPDMTTLSKDKYNEMVESMGLKDQVITDDVLHGAKPGDVASYIWNSNGNDSDYTWSGDFSTINGGESGTSITQSITEEKTSKKSVSWNVSRHTEVSATIGGVTAGLSTTLEYSGAKASISMHSITAEGSVARIPNVDSGKAISKADETGVKDIAVRDNYGFKFRVGTWLTKLGQNDCRVVGYQVKPIADNAKFPPKPVDDIEVEKIYDEEGNYGGVKVRWYEPESGNDAYYSKPRAYKVWMVGSDVTRKAIYASNSTVDENGKKCYEYTFKASTVPENTAFAAAVRPIELSDDYACCSNPIYIMEQGVRDAIFSTQPKDTNYQAAEANKSGKAQFSSVVKLYGENLTFDYAEEKVRWQFYNPSTRTWKEVFEIDQSTFKRKAAKELEKYGISSVEDSLSNLDKIDIRKEAGTATLEFSYDKIPVDIKFRLAVAYSVNATTGVFNAISDEVGFSLQTTSISDAKMDVSEQGISLRASTKNDEEGSVIAAKLKNLSNNASSKKILVYPNNVVDLVSIAPGVYQMETQSTLSNTGAAVSDRIPYYGNTNKLLATLATKKTTLKSAASGAAVQADVEDLKFGDKLQFTTELYDKNAADPNLPQSVDDVKYTVVSGAQDEDVTGECMKGSVFSPNSAGEFTITATVETADETLVSKKIVKVAAAGERYEKEVFDKILNTNLSDIQGIVYGTEKDAEALGLPKTTQIQTVSGEIYEANIKWDMKNCDYAPTSTKEQSCKVKGSVVLPDHVSNDSNVSTDVAITLNVNANVIEVQKAEDNQPPVVTLKGSITVGGKTYSDYSNKISFDTELTGAQKVVITGSDEEDAIDSISYLKSASVLSQEQLKKSNAWTTGAELTLAEGERCVVYARIISRTGDVLYLSTQGIVVKKASSSVNQTPVKPKDTAKVGKTYTVKKIKYKVIANGKKKTVQVTGVTNKKMKSLTIPATVTILGQKYQVTAIKESAFKNMKKLSKVVIGKNVNKIGKNAFSGCKKLKNILIKSSKWKKNSIGKKAFYKIAAKPKFKVPAKKLKTYKKFIKQSKVAKKAKFTK